MRDRLIELIDKAKEEYANDVTDHTETEYIVETLLNDDWIRPPCKVGDEINGEVVHQIKYMETLVSEGKTNRLKIIQTCNKDDVEKLILTTHPMTWEKAEAKLKGGVQE